MFSGRLCEVVEMPNKLITPKQFVKDLIRLEAKACKKYNLKPGSVIKHLAIAMPR
jgi:hypothetical protein